MTAKDFDGIGGANATRSERRSVNADAQQSSSGVILNGDENDEALNFIGNFHKTFSHNCETGQIEKKDHYKNFAAACDDPKGDFENLTYADKATKLVNPQAKWAKERLGPNPDEMEMLPPPQVLSTSTAAEMVELFWMAKMRDVPFNKFHLHSSNAISEIHSAYQIALDGAKQPGTEDKFPIQLGLDLFKDTSNNLRIDNQTLFRCGLPDEDLGPFVSQFMLHDINYGAQTIKQQVVPYKEGKNFLISFDDWLLAQDTGKDRDNNGYGSCNNYHDGIGRDGGNAYYEAEPRPISTMRDLARFVNRDALHQAYANAALLLLIWGAEEDAGNPYNSYKHQLGFGTLGDPNLLALVAEMATRALKVVWYQKWSHRRLRPEAYGGILHVQLKKNLTNYKLPAFLTTSGQLEKTKKVMLASEYLLPMAVSAGSPTHPSYGAGHATVAGACVTLLKAWFNDKQKIVDIKAFEESNFPNSNGFKQRDPSPYYPENFSLDILDPGKFTSDPDRLPAYTASDREKMTIGGELNKLAMNVAMGRSMAGVHWRTDNTRSLRLGEKVATIMLAQILPTYHEKPVFTYTNFDGKAVTIDGKKENKFGNATVTVDQDPTLSSFFNSKRFGECK